MPHAPDNPSRDPAHGLTSRQIDAIKGFLILLIVVGHSDLLVGTFDRVYTAIYYFHVTAFFLLPFLFHPRPPTRSFLADRAVRYLVPYAAFYLAAGTIFYIYDLAGHTSVLAWMRDWILGLVVASPVTQVRASGILIYYFLPALWVMVALRAAYFTSGRSARLIWIAVAVGAHLLVGAAPQWIKDYIPFSLPLVLYLFLLGLIVTAGRVLLPKRPSLPAAVVTVVAAAGLILPALWMGVRVDIASLRVASLFELPTLALHDAIVLCCFVAIVCLAPALARLPGMALLGRHSLGIYLSHLLFIHALKILFSKIGLANLAGQSSLPWLAVRLALAMALSLGLSMAIQAWSPLRRNLFPRTRSDWPVIQKSTPDEPPGN